MLKVLRFVKWALLIAVVLILGAQVIRPARTNPSVDQALSIENQMKVEPQVESILERSCFDCHSDKTVWPWYSNVAPVSWFLINHVNEGRRHLNFSQWGQYDQNRRRARLREICDQVKAKEMPLSSYTPLHPKAKLTGTDIGTLCNWASRDPNSPGSP